jgi:hypothetical protein
VRYICWVKFGMVSASPRHVLKYIVNFARGAIEFLSPSVKLLPLLAFFTFFFFYPSSSNDDYINLLLFIL